LWFALDTLFIGAYKLIRLGGVRKSAGFEAKLTPSRTRKSDRTSSPGCRWVRTGFLPARPLARLSRPDLAPIDLARLQAGEPSSSKPIWKEVTKTMAAKKPAKKAAKKPAKKAAKKK
jgi:hypothetical protein